MSNLHDRFSVSSRYRGSPDNAVSYTPAQGSRTVLPPLTAFASPYSGRCFHLRRISFHFSLIFLVIESAHDSVPQRMSPSRNEVFSPSFGQGHWPNNGRKLSMKFDALWISCLSSTRLFFSSLDGWPSLHQLHSL